MAKRLQLEEAGRGLLRADFIDLYGNHCSIQESSLADVDAIWLGVHETRMHLNREQAESLIPLLERFVKTGFLHPAKRQRKVKDV